MRGHLMAKRSSPKTVYFTWHILSVVVTDYIW